MGWLCGCPAGWQLGVVRVNLGAEQTPSGSRLPWTQPVAACPEMVAGASPCPGWGVPGSLARRPCIFPDPPPPVFENEKRGRKARRALAAGSKKQSCFHFFLLPFLFAALLVINEAAQSSGWVGGMAPALAPFLPQGSLLPAEAAD